MPTTDSIATPPLLRRLQTPPQQSAKTATTERGEAGIGQADTVKTEGTKSLLKWKAPKPFKLTDVRFAQESYFKDNPYYRPELGMSHSGIRGDPAPCMLCLGYDSLINVERLHCKADKGSFPSPLSSYKCRRNRTRSALPSLFGSADSITLEHYLLLVYTV